MCAVELREGKLGREEDEDKDAMGKTTKFPKQSRDKISGHTCILTNN